MSRRPLIVFILVLSLLAAGSSFGNRPSAQKLPESIVRIGVIQKVNSFNLSCGERYYLYELSSGKQCALEPLVDLPVKGDGSSLIFGGKEYAAPVRLVPVETGSCIRINGRRYRDTLFITCTSGKLTVINELGLENYIYGILPREANPSWAIESLKAQAVVSRTYALRNLRRHERDGFDLCTQTHCQVYGGVESEDERCNKAVDETRGEVLVYKGELAQTLFHAACGGHTEIPNNVWSWERPAPEYLCGRRDKYCGDSPHDSWENKIPAATIRKKLVQAGYPVGEIKRIRMSGKSSSGRAKKLIISHSKGTSCAADSRVRTEVVPTAMMRPSAFMAPLIDDAASPLIS